MRFQKFFLTALLAFTPIKAASKVKCPNNAAIKVKPGSVNTGIFKYNFHCVTNYRNMCPKLYKYLQVATDSLTSILDESSKVKFEVFVDDFSKYRNDKTKDTIALALSTDLTTALNEKNKNYVFPYPNAQALKANFKDKDFVLLLNSFKSDPKYLSTIQDEVTNILLEIYEGLFTLKKLPYPYNERKVDSGASEIDSETMAPILLGMRLNATLTNSLAEQNDEKYGKFMAANHLPEIIHWEDTLISKGKKNFPRNGYDYKRIVAVGDVHGDFKKLIRVLRHAKLINKNNDWIGTDSILVQIGDLTDRGPDFKQIIELFMKIREQAQKKGGIVYNLLGNHECYDMQSGYVLISKKDFDSFGGYLEREKAISINGKYGPFLRKEMNLTMIVDDNLFIHAGLTTKYAQKGIQELNDYVHDLLTNAPSFDVLYNDYYSKNMSHPFMYEPMFDMTNKQSPLWTKFYSEGSEEEVCEEIDKVLDMVNAKRMIVGHVIQEYGKIRVRCNGKIFLIDVALSECLGNYGAYLEIRNDKREIWTRYIEIKPEKK